MAAEHLITLGIGTPSDIAHFILFGLSPSGAAPEPEPEPTTDYVLTIGGVEFKVLTGTVSLMETMNGRNTLTCEVYRDDGSGVALDEDVELTEDGETMFGGLIDSARRRGFRGNAVEEITTVISVGDYSALADRRFVVASITAGTLKAWLLVIEPYLTPYGVTLDPAQVDGPAMPALEYDYRLLRDALDEASSLSGGYAWEIDKNKILRMVQPGAVAAPFDLVPGADVTDGDVSIEPTREDYANRVIVRAGTGTRDLEDEQHNGDGSDRSFVLDAPVVNIIGTANVYRSGVFENGYPVGIYGVDAMAWTFDAATNSLIQDAGETVLAIGDWVLINYTAGFPLTVQADDAGEQSAHGIYETFISSPDTFSRSVAVALAEAILVQRAVSLNRAQYDTFERGLKPGMTQTIDLDARGVDSSFIITEISTRDEPNGVGLFRRSVTAIEGQVFTGTWRDKYKQWAGRGSSSSSSVSVAGGGGGGASTVLASPFPLGGARNTSIAANPAAWTPVVNFLDYVAQSTFPGRVRVDLFARHAGISAQARLKNVTDNAVANTSSVETSQNAVSVTFVVPIASGKTYRLEVLSGTNDEGVFAIGTLEPL